MTEVTTFETSLAFAEKVHKSQKRKGKETPYIDHIYDVVTILMLLTEDEELWSAGALHDTVEDCRPYGSVTIAIIKELAGGRVAKIVEDLTESDKTLPWEVRKQQALEHIAEMDEDSLLVKTADILSNLKEMVLDLETIPQEQFFKRFNAGREKTISSYIKRYEALKMRWPENPLLLDLKSVMDHFLELVNR